MELRDCQPAAVGGYTSVDRLRLRYRFLGMVRTADISLGDFAVFLDSPPLCSSTSP